MLCGEERTGSSGRCGLGGVSLAGEGVLGWALSVGEVSMLSEHLCASSCCFMCALHVQRTWCVSKRGEGGEGGREGRGGGEGETHFWNFSEASSDLSLCKDSLCIAVSALSFLV